MNTATITISGFATTAEKTTAHIWSIDMRSNGIVWKLMEKATQPGYFFLVNSAGKMLGKWFKLEKGTFTEVRTL